LTAAFLLAPSYCRWPGSVLQRDAVGLCVCRVPQDGRSNLLLVKTKMIRFKGRVCLLFWHSLHLIQQLPASPAISVSVLIYLSTTRKVGDIWLDILQQ